MEGGSVSRCGSRLIAAHIRSKTCARCSMDGGQLFFVWIPLALGPTVFVLNFYGNFAEGVRFLFELGASPSRCAHWSQ
eukprot:3856686-Pyramimonas_sp.AAC.1